MRWRQNKNGMRFLLRTGGICVLVLTFLTVLDIKKEEYIGNLYQDVLYRAFAQGRYLTEREAEPDSFYFRIINEIPLLKALYRNHGTGIDAADEENAKESPGQDNAVVAEKEIRTKITYSYSGEINGQTTLPLAELVRAENESATGSNVPEGSLTVREIRMKILSAYNWNLPDGFSQFLKDYYIADPSVGSVEQVIRGNKLLNYEAGVQKITEEPQILIYHTHGTERYADSRDGESADTVVGMGDILKEELEAMGWSVLHDRTTYDYMDGKNNHSYAYSTARTSVQQILEKYPSVEVVLDIHRDSGAARTTEINGEKTARIMLFNGLCRNADGPISYLENPYLEQNLAFSLQLNLLGRERYPGLMYKIYLKNYRYNMHLCERYLLVELGTEKNTVAEASNAIRLFAPLLSELLINSCQ